jgi:hypothetical protein
VLLPSSVIQVLIARGGALTAPRSPFDPHVIVKLPSADTAQPVSEARLRPWWCLAASRCSAATEACSAPRGLKPHDEHGVDVEIRNYCGVDMYVLGHSFLKHASSRSRRDRLLPMSLKVEAAEPLPNFIVAGMISRSTGPRRTGLDDLGGLVSNTRCSPNLSEGSLDRSPEAGIADFLRTDVFGAGLSEP